MSFRIWRLGLSVFLVTLWVPALGASPSPGDGGLALTLEEAIARALEQSENLVIERASQDAAAAAVDGARGAYDPQLEFSAGFRRSLLPVNSAFSGAPEGEVAPTDESFEGSAGVRQLLSTGGTVSLRAVSSRTETDGSFGLLSPAYGSQLGVELRQPLLQDRKVDAARLTLRVAAADRDFAAASLKGEVRDTIAAVEAAYWTLAAQRRGVEVRERTIALAQEQLDETELRIESGVSPEMEISQPRAELERRRGELLAAREAAARAENALKLLVLGDGEADLWSRAILLLDPVTGPAEEVDPSAAMAEALASRAELLAAQAALERSRAESLFAEDRIRPSLDLVVSYDRFGLTGSRNSAASPIPGLDGEVPPQLEGGLGSSLGALFDGDFEDARIALELAFPLGNRRARADVEIARAADRQAEADLSRARKAIRVEVLDAVATLRTAGPASRPPAPRGRRPNPSFRRNGSATTWGFPPTFWS